ncbi:MAG TPA: GNAT family N-acetyltransferase [Pyrinomonadaceae bacterium]|nr:GNAT family N-acetyltransferase [Pyrinomonadaceae bacterium]
MTRPFNYRIRPAAQSDEPFLWEMLYQSLYVEGQEPFPRDVVQRPHIARYVKGWGRDGDLGFVAVDEASGQPIGAVWIRQSGADDPGFAYLDERTPEMGIALLPEYRGKGLGGALIERLLEAVKNLYPAISLSVSPNNRRAIRLYERKGFVTVDVRNDFPVMRKDLTS